MWSIKKCRVNPVDFICVLKCMRNITMRVIPVDFIYVLKRVKYKKWRAIPVDFIYVFEMYEKYPETLKKHRKMECIL